MGDDNTNMYQAGYLPHTWHYYLDDHMHWHHKCFLIVAFCGAFASAVPMPSILCWLVTFAVFIATVGFESEWWWVAIVLEMLFAQEMLFFVLPV